jgi:large subunit ribosomal protein L10
MAVLKPQKEKDLAELTAKLKDAKAVVFTDFRGTTVKDLDKFRKTLAKENVFSKVYKITLLRLALKAIGVADAAMEYKTPVILSLSTEDETTPARVIKNLSKDIKTLSILEGVADGKLLSKAQVMALADLLSKDQLRSQFMSVLNGPMSAFVRVLNAHMEKMGSSSAEATEDTEAAPAATPVPAAEPVAA